MPPGKKRVALMPISVNEPILNGKISAEGQGASIAALLPDGMRAASVRINDVSGVAGFVQPNDSVDVLITRQPPVATAINRRPTCCCRTFALSRSISKRRTPMVLPSSPRPRPCEVAPIDAQKLALAQQVGDLSLVLAQARRTERPGRRDGQPQRPPLQHVRRRSLSGAGGCRQLRNGCRRSDGRRRCEDAAESPHSRLLVRRTAGRARRPASRRPPTPESRSTSIAAPRASK